jgi:hypothetical protein
MTTETVWGPMGALAWIGEIRTAWARVITTRAASISIFRGAIRATVVWIVTLTTTTEAETQGARRIVTTMAVNGILDVTRKTKPRINCVETILVVSIILLAQK